MKDLNEFKSFNNALVNYFMAEQKMLYHSQVSQLANAKMINSAKQLYNTISQIKEIPDQIKQELQQAIDKRDIKNIMAVSVQVQEIVNRLSTKYFPRSK
jgi:predicted nucleic acid-binding protein